MKRIGDDDDEGFRRFEAKRFLTFFNVKSVESEGSDGGERTRNYALRH